MQWQELRSHIRHLSARDITKIGQAFELGKKMHEGQKRRSGEPYFNHPVAVAHMLLDLKADADTIIAALLHDTVEDTPLTLAEIDNEFDGATAALIDGVTKLSSADVAMSPKLDEQIETLRKIFTLMQQDVRIMVIKLVDRLHNMQTVEFLPEERQHLLAKETIEVFVKIADKLCMQDMRDELESLCLAVLEPETYSALLELRNSNELRGTAVIDQIRSSFRTHDRILGSKTDLLFEHKTWDQMKAQLNAGESAATGVSFITVAMICEDIDACYRTLGALHQLWKREATSFQDFINVPQLNGYRGLHTTIIAQDGTRVRCKIRTKEMHRYARQGVTTVCFDGATEMSEILPWTKRLSSLASDTEGSSNNFWENLKSDILGESIVIHGPADSTVQLPREATALDGAFYLLQEEALRTTSIKLNGVVVPFSTSLTNAASLDVQLAPKNMCSRDWLSQVRTGFAAANIRKGLMKEPEEQKLVIGREMLQRIFTTRKRGFIHEFQEVTVQKPLEHLGYGSLHDVYIAIADGRLEPEHVYAALFDKPERQQSVQSRVSIVRYTIDSAEIESLEQLKLVHRKYQSALSDVHYHREKNAGVSVTIRARLSPAELSAFQTDLKRGGGRDISARDGGQTWLVLAISIVILWALNPVIAKWLLLHGMTPLSLVTIRFLTFFGYTTTFYAIWRMVSKTKYTPVPGLALLTALPALGLMGMSFFNYFALTQMPPSLHLTILRLNTLLLPLVMAMRKGFLLTRSSAFTLALFALLLILTLGIPDAPTFAVLSLSIMALVSYTFYSLISEHVLREKQISLRYPLFAMYLGLLLGIAGLLLLPWQSSEDLLNSHTLATIVYVLICVCVPHMLYSMLLRRMSFTNFTDIFLLEVPFAMGFEYWLLGLALLPALYGVIGIILVVLLLRRWRNFRLQIF